MSKMLDEELHKLMELPWTKTFILLMRKASLDNLFKEHQSSFSPFLQKQYAVISSYTLLDAFRLDNIIRLLSDVSMLEGDIIECGSYKGGCALLMALWLKENNIRKKIYVFDSFEGLPEPNSQFDKGYTKGQFTANLDAFLQKTSELNLQGFIQPVKGWFKDTMPPFLKERNAKQYVLFHVDCDLYESTKDCFPVAFPYVADNGVVIFDDFNDGARGEKKAVIEDLKDAYTIEVGPASQSYLIKSTHSNSGIKDGHLYYSFEELRKNKAYLNWVNVKTGIAYEEMLSEYLGGKKSN